ncbi:MAG: DUF1648 domain-containing protein [Vulcanimicrobiaceae bacterium]
MSSRRAALESLALVGTLALIGVAVWGLSTLPDSIAVRWGAAGTPEYGSKNMLLLLPAIGVLGYCLSGFATGAAVPRLNLPIKITITPENSAAVYALERELMVALKAAVAAGFAGMEWQFIASAGGTLSAGFIPTIVGFTVVVFALIAAYTVAIAKAAKPRPE